MSALSLVTRSKRQGVLCNLGEHAIQLARLSALDQRPVVVDRLSEFPLGSEVAVVDWLAGINEAHSSYTQAYCGFHPTQRVLLREAVNSRRLAESGYLESLFGEQAKLSKIKDWQIAALNPLDGEQFSAATLSRPGLLVGLPRSAARETQQQLCQVGLRPRRLEVGSVVLLGALTHYLRDAGYVQGVVACEIGVAQTRVYFVAKDGIHTPAALPHGLRSIEEAAMKELDAPDLSTAHARLLAPTEELSAHGRRLVRALTRHLKPAVDYFEMQTGQLIGALFCANLPSGLGWLEQALAVAIDREFLEPDLAAWLPKVGVRLGSDTALPGRSWFQALSLVGELTPSS